jgi:hypothetical protein
MDHFLAIMHFPPSGSRKRLDEGLHECRVWYKTLPRFSVLAIRDMGTISGTIDGFQAGTKLANYLKIKQSPP